MLVNIEIVQPPDLMTQASFNIEDFKEEKDFREALAIIFMISAEYYLDPEFELTDMKDFTQQAINKSKQKLVFLVSEEGLELEFV
jgi:hypothetical protein